MMKRYPVFFVERMYFGFGRSSKGRMDEALMR